MDSILICPDKKKGHRSSHQLLSERVKEIREKCCTSFRFSYNTVVYRGKKVVRIRHHMQAMKRWGYHMHPKVDENNPYSKFYSRLVFGYGSLLSKKYKTYNLPEKSQSQDIVEDTKIEPEVDEKYFAKKKIFLKGKNLDFKDYKKCVPVEEKIISMYLKW